MNDPNIYKITDPLDCAAGDVDTSYPLLPGGKTYTFNIAEVEKNAATPKAEGEDSKEIPEDNIVLPDDDPRKKWNLKIRLETTTEQRSVSGEPLDAGFPLTAHVALDTRGKDYPIAKVKKGIAQVLQAVFGAKTEVPLSTLRNNPELIKDHVVECKVKISKPTAAYPNPSNNIGAWIPLKS